MPDEPDELVKLPRVGPYTASAVLCFGFRKDVPIVDVNVVRVFERVFELHSQKKRPHSDPVIWEFAAKLVPKGFEFNYNEALLDFAALVCKKKPLCDICPVSNLCIYRKKRP